MVRRFGATEHEALASLRGAILERIATVTEPSAPNEEPEEQPLSEADRTIFSARDGFRAFTQHVYSTDRFVAEDSDAARDREAAGNDVIPTALVDGYVSSIVDHLQAWVDKTGGRSPEPQLWLSLYSDYTLFRPVLESLAAAIWILGPNSTVERVKNAVKLAATEHEKARQYVEGLRRANRPDEESERVNDALGRLVREVCTRMDFEADRIVGVTVDPSALPRKASRFVPGSDAKFHRLWSVCSAHAHAQLFSVLRHASRTEIEGHRGAGTYAEVDSETFAEVVAFTGDALNVLVTLLNRRGFVLERVQTDR